MTDAPNPFGFTDALERICANRCAEFGDPPCWRLPELVEPCELIEPCDECKADLADDGGGGHLTDKIALAYDSGDMPPLLPGPK